MKHHLLSVFGMALVVVCAPPAAGQPAGPWRFAASAAIGVSRPIDVAMSDVYGASLMPVMGQVDFHVASGVSMFGGIRWVSSDGRTVVVGAPVADEQYSTSLRTISYRFGLLASARLAARWSVAAGGGLSITNYKETWPDAGQSVSDQATGFLVLGEARYRVSGRWSATARVEYMRAAARTSASGADVNLGGVDVLGGLRFSF